MGKKLVSRTAKVLSETKRRGGKEAIAIAYEHIPRDPEEQKHGSLFAVIEIEDTGGHAEEIAERIIDVLHNEYYHNLERSPLASFESALAKINEELADRSSEGQINWLGKLNAVLGVLNGSTLHLTQGGKAEAYLYRAEHTLHITDGLSGDSLNPARTFINVASGDLTEKDKMVFVTPGIFYKISKNELKKYVNDNSPKIASENISRLLSGENGNNIPNSILIMEMLSPEAFAVEPEPEAAAETWVKDEKNIMEPVAEQTMQGTAKAFEMLGKAAAGASTFIATKAMPTIKTKGKSLVKSFAKEPNSERIILESEERLNPSLDYDRVLEPEREESLREIRIKERDVRPNLLSTLERFNFSKKTNGLGQSFKKIKMPRGKISLIYIIIAVAVIGLLSGFLIYNSVIGKQKTAATNTLKQAKVNYEEAISAITLGDRPTAIEELSTAEKLANEVKNGKYQVAEANALLKEIENAKDQAFGTIRNTAKEIITLETETEALFTDGKLIYALDFDKGALFSIDPKAGTKATILESTDLEGKIKSATYLTSRNLIIAYTENGELYEINPRTKAVTKQNVTGELSTPIAISSYLTTLYILSPSTNQIDKHIKSGSGYGRASDYFKAETDIKAALDFAIDSSVYVLLKNGGIQKFTAGTAETFTLNNLPSPITNAKNIYTSPETTGLYISDGEGIYKIDENKKYVAKYVSDSAKNIKGFLAIDGNSSIYLQSGGKIYSISF